MAVKGRTHREQRKNVTRPESYMSLLKISMKHPLGQPQGPSVPFQIGWAYNNKQTDTKVIEGYTQTDWSKHMSYLKVSYNIHLLSTNTTHSHTHTYTVKPWKNSEYS